MILAAIALTPNVIICGTAQKNTRKPWNRALSTRSSIRSSTSAGILSWCFPRTRWTGVLKITVSEKIRTVKLLPGFQCYRKPDSSFSMLLYADLICENAPQESCYSTAFSACYPVIRLPSAPVQASHCNLRNLLLLRERSVLCLHCQRSRLSAYRA